MNIFDGSKLDKTNFELKDLEQITSIILDGKKLNGDINIVNFDEVDYTIKSFEKYSNLDAKFGRCGVAFANICKEIMPSNNDERESLNYNPTGWKQKRYNGEYLYNRCHFII